MLPRGLIRGCLAPFAAAVPLALAACTHNMGVLQVPGRSAAVTTTGPWASMIYVARTDSGVIAIDLGWTSAEEHLREALREVGATPADVTDVFLTHSHRDHIAAWPLVRHARFHLAASEVDRLVGREEHGGWAAELADDVNPPDLPKPGELSLVPFGSDTAIVVGVDTLRAFPIPGHTAGSAAYLFRGVLFVGDAVNRRLFTFGGATWEYSDDRARNRASLESLQRRTRPFDPRYLCTAHAKCGRLDAELWASVQR